MTIRSYLNRSDQSITVRSSQNFKSGHLDIFPIYPDISRYISIYLRYIPIYLDISPIFLPIFPIYLRYISDISPIFPIYRRYISQKITKNVSHARVSHVSKFRPKYRPDSDISPIYRRYLPIFGDFSSKRLNVSKIASLASDTRNIAYISADISDILVLGCD